jgi:hypothetical protein
MSGINSTQSPLTTHTLRATYNMRLSIVITSHSSRPGMPPEFSYRRLVFILTLNLGCCSSNAEKADSGGIGKISASSIERIMLFGDSSRIVVRSWPTIFQCSYGLPPSTACLKGITVNVISSRPSPELGERSVCVLAQIFPNPFS